MKTGFFASAAIAMAMLAAGRTQAAEYTTILLEKVVDRTPDQTWAKIGPYCAIAQWLKVTCVITAGNGARARREGNAVAHGLQVAFLQTGQEPHPLAQRVREVDLTRHGGLGDRGDLRAAPATLRQQVDHLSLQQGGVRVQHDQVLRTAVQPGRLHGDVDLTARRRTVFGTY